MATNDLCDLDFARQQIPTSIDSDEPTISTFITNASTAVRKYCRRDFISTAYDELYNGTGDKRLILRQYPIISVQSCRYRPVTVLKVINNDLANNQQARVTVTATGLTLQRIASGVSNVNTLTFASSVTLTALAAAITAIGNGWLGQVIGDYTLWPSADLYTPQGALTAWGQFAELKMHTYELAGYQIDARRGWLLRAIPYTDPELLHPEDLIWPPGVNNFRVQYTAGYATIPEDVQQATAMLVTSWFVERGRDLNISQEAVSGSYSYSIEQAQGQLPNRVKALLRPYRAHRIFNNMG